MWGQRNLSWISCGICVIFIILCALNIFDYSFDMKQSEYKSFILNLILLIAFFESLYAISKLFEIIPGITKVMQWIGNNTITIMYWHIPLNEILINR